MPFRSTRVARPPTVIAACLGCAGLALATACSEAPSPGPTPPPPNVVVVLADTLRADFLSVYGDERNISPSIAAFAREAVVFEQATSQAACTFPSVNSLLTSRHAVEFVDQPGGRLGIPAEVPTLAGILRENGFETHAISASPVVRANPSKVNRHGGFDGGFDSFDDSCQWRPAPCVSRRARKLLESVQRPFALYLHYMDPHGPYAPPQQFERRFTRPYTGENDYVAKGNPSPIAELLLEGTPPEEIPAEDIEHLRQLYSDEVAWFDHVFAQLLAMLRQTGHWDDTLIVLASDHGEEFLEHDTVKHCRSLYAPLVHVPLILRLPGGTPSGRRDQLVQNLDLVPTLLDFAGIDPGRHDLAGRSLRPMIEDDVAVRDHAFSFQGTRRSIRGPRFKLILDLATGEQQLFDLSADPGETRDLASSHPAERDRLRAALEDWRTRAGDRAGETIPGADLDERLRALGYLE